MRAPSTDAGRAHHAPRWLSAVLRLALLALAGWALRGELQDLNARDLVVALRGYGPLHVALGLAATAASFALLGVIEVMALRYAGRDDIPRRTGLTTGFVANALSQSIGVALLTGAAVRVRAYRRYAVDGGELARMSAFVTITVTLGLLATGAVAFLASAAPLHLWHVEVPVRPVGAMLAATVLAYLGWSAAGRRDSVGRGAWRITRPRAGLALAQTAVSSLDWIVTGSVFFLVLPAAAGIGYATSLRVYLVAQTVGTLSHVPGGAGVFELLVIALLMPALEPGLRAALVASLVLFRVLYYLVPLVVASAVSVVAELRRASPTLVPSHDP